MRITNKTEETISIEPGETINIRHTKESVRTMSRRIDKILINKIANRGRK